MSTNYERALEHVVTTVDPRAKAVTYALLAIVDELRGWQGAVTQVNKNPDASWLDTYQPAAAPEPPARITKPEPEAPNTWADQIEEREEKEQHIIEFQEFGWTLTHPAACRNGRGLGLEQCPVTKVAQRGVKTPPQGLGRYVAQQSGYLLLIGAPIPPRLERA